MAAVPAVQQKQAYKRLLVDAATALTAAITVSPIVAALDKYVLSFRIHRQFVTDVCAPTELLSKAQRNMNHFSHQYASLFRPSYDIRTAS